MMINTDRPYCKNCGVEIEVMSRTVVDATDDGIVVLVTGLCTCRDQWYQWYEHYSYKGYLCLEETRGYYTIPIDNPENL